MIIACVVPAYNEENFIGDVLARIPDFISYIIVVNDCSTDQTAAKVKGMADPRIHLIDLTCNQGVGGAVIEGYKKALELRSDIVVKIDGDNQMDPADIERLIAPIREQRADYAKGVRFRNPRILRTMPTLRLVGNIGLSFLTKMASGYWHVFDPTNGFTAISRAALKRLPLDELNPRYLFETDMLTQLYRIQAVVVDVETSIRYGDEVSQLNPVKSIIPFGWFLWKSFCKRIFWSYFVFDFSPVSIFLLFGSLLFVFGFIFGSWHWTISILHKRAAPTGTIMLSVVPLLLGFQLLLQAAVLDIGNAPKNPLTAGEAPVRPLD